MEFKGKLVTDANLIKEPQESWVTAWNMVLDKGFSSLKNEDGFELKVELGFTVIGRVSTPSGIVLLSVNAGETISRIEIYNPDTDTLTKILEADTTSNATDCELNFHLENPIEIHYKYNFKKELIVAFWDGIQSNSNKPKMINLDRLPFSVDGNMRILAADKTKGKQELISLFPDMNVPIMNTVTKDGGGLIEVGAVYFAIAYYIDEVDTTNWSNLTIPTYITNYNYQEDATISKQEDKVAKSIIVNITQLDLKFGYFKLAAIKKTSTGTYPVMIGKYDIPASGNKTVIFNGTFEEELSLDEIIIPTDSYERIKTGTNFNGQLLVGNLVSRSVLNYQPYANAIEIQFQWDGAGKIHRDLGGQNPDSAKNLSFTNDVAQNKTFMPDEVYALYIHWILKTGQVTEGYHIPGRVVVSNELDPVSGIAVGEEALIDNSGGSAAKRFHTRDTAIYAGANIGAMGYWENADEVYPDTDDFDILDVDVNGLPVITGLDIRGDKVRHHKFPSNIWEGNELKNLGFQALNVKIPAEMLDKVQGYTISYAIREGVNKTILGSSPLVTHGNSQGTPDPAFPGAVIAGTPIPLNKTIRYYDYKLLNDKEQISPSYLKTQYKSAPILIPHPTVALTFNEGRYGDTGNCDAPVLNFFKVNGYEYIPEDNSATVPNNKFREAYLQLKTYSDIPVLETIQQELLFTPFQTIHIYNLCAFVLNVYQNFYSQEVAFTTYRFPTSANTYVYNPIPVLYDGDCFISNPNFTILQPVLEEILVGGTPELYAITCITATGSLAWTNKCYYLWRSQLYFSHRFNKKGDDVYPLKSVIINATDGDTFSNKVVNGSVYNHYEYNRVYSSVNNIKKVGCYNPFLTFIEELPFRIAISNRYQSEAQGNNWRTFTSYFEMPNNKGEIWVLNSSDRIIYIQMKYSLFTTGIKDKLAGSNEETYLGITSIFDRPPEEIVIEKDGYIGCQSQWGAIVCKHGYIVVDKERGKIFVYSGSIDEITRLDNFEFFKKHLEASSSFVDKDNPFTDKGICIGFNDEDNILVISKNYLADEDTKSFTITYNFDRKGFIARHTYIANSLVYNRKSLFSIKTDTNISSIFRHNNKLNKAIYYVADAPDASYVDVIFNLENDVNKSFGSFNWKTEIKNLVDKATIFHKTATHVMIYNEVQCTGMIPLITAKSAFTGNNSRQIRGTWHFNAFRDAVINSDVAFLDEDRNILINNYNFNKNWFDKSKFFGKFVAIRLYYDNVDQQEFIVNSIDVTQKLNNIH